MTDTSELVRSYMRELRASGKSPRTLQSYQEAIGLLDTFLDGTDLADVSKADVAEFLTDQLARHKPASAAVRYRALRAFYRWAAAEELIDRNPMAGMTQPKVPEEPVPILTDAEIDKLFKVTSGKDFVSRRDHAILRLLRDTGVRLSALVGLTVADVDLGVHDVIHVVGKGNRPRAVPFNSQTGKALDRYLRERASHVDAARPELLLGVRGPVKQSGVAQILGKRGREAGVENVHPHRFRHTAAHAWKAAGGGDDSAMRLFGWRSREMLSRYGASAADARAVEEYRRLNP
jgi:site-specific recombinase XerD